MEKKTTSNAVSEYLILSAVVLSQFIMPFMFSGISVTLPKMGIEMNASAVALGLVEIVFLGASSALMLPFGKFADLTNKEAMFKTGLLFTAFTTLLLGFTYHIYIFIGIRIIQGVAFAMIVSANMAILTECIPRERLGKAFGISLGAVYSGLSVGPMVGGVITEYLGWRWIYYITCLVLLVAFWQASRVLKGKWQKPIDQFDLRGSLIIVLIIGLWICGSAMLDKSIVGVTMLVVGTILIPILLWVESNVKLPLLEVQLFKTNTRFSFALLIQLFTYAGSFGVTFLFSLYLQTVLLYSPKNTGLILMVSPVLMAILAPLFGRLSDKLNARLLATGGVISMLLGTIVATQISNDSPIYFVYFVLVFHGIGFAMFSSPNMKIIMTAVDRTRYSVASALAAEMRSLGMVVSMLLITLFLSLIMGQTLVTDDQSDSLVLVMHYSFIALAVLGAISLVLSIQKINAKNVPIKTKK